MKEQIIQQAKKHGVEFIKLQFTDILGNMKNINITIDLLEKALDNQIMFDGSSIDGFARIEESDMYLYPDLNTFIILPGEISGSVVEARIICDIYTADGKPFEGDPRYILKKALAEAAKDGYTMYAGPELEFFLFKLDQNGNPTLTTNDKAGYFDLSTIDKGHVAKREMCLVLKKMGFVVEASHHECAPGQHEIDFKYEDALKAADYIITFKAVVKQIAEKYGFYATFMPKPISGIAGSGMHLNMSLFKNDVNAFYDENDEYKLSEIAYSYIAGLLNHAKGLSVITNPNINSYKRLVAGYEAPVNIAWAFKNRSPLIRIPTAKGNATRVELRNPDPSCNPYLTIAVSLVAGLNGIKNSITPPAPANFNIYEQSKKELDNQNIEVLPENLKVALDYMLKDDLIKETLGDHVVNTITNAVTKDWNEYQLHITTFEIDRYLHL